MQSFSRAGKRNRVRGMSLSPKALSDGVWSLIGSVGSAIAGLATVKLVASWVDSASYGEASLLLGVISLLTGVAVGPLLVIHLRLYFDYATQGLARWFARTTNVAIAGVSSATVLLYLIIASVYWWNGESLYFRYALIATLVLFAQPFLGVKTNCLEALRRQRALAVVSLSNRALYPLIVLILLTIQQDAVGALVAGQGLAAICVLAASAGTTPKRTGSGTSVDVRVEHRKLLNSVLQFGWTLPAGYVAMWVVTTSDRYLVQHFMTARDVGLYVMNYALWSMPFILLNTWLELMTRSVIYAAGANANWRRAWHIVRLRAIVGTALAIFGGSILFVLSEQIGHILVGSEYWISRTMVLILCAAHSCYVTGYAVVPLFLAAKRPRWVFYATVLAGLLGVVCNLVVIPIWGLVGAAFATLLSYAVWTMTLLIGARALVSRLERS